MDPAIIFEDTEQTQFCPQTDGQGETSIPLSTLLRRGFNYLKININNKVSLFPDTFNNKQQIHIWWLIVSGLGWLHDRKWTSTELWCETFLFLSIFSAPTQVHLLVYMTNLLALCLGIVHVHYCLGKCKVALVIIKYEYTENGKLCGCSE